jgi:Ca2+-binding EF-hand superfamily protein
LSSEDLDDILRGMGFRPSKEELKDILEEIDEDGSGEIEFAEFCQVSFLFLITYEIPKRMVKADYIFHCAEILLGEKIKRLKIYSK